MSIMKNDANNIIQVLKIFSRAKTLNICLLLAINLIILDKTLSIGYHYLHNH